MATSVDNIVLFNTQTTSANGATKIHAYPEQKSVFKVWGVWNGATVALQVAAPTALAANTWIPCKDRNGNLVSFTADGMAFLEDMCINEQVRAVLTNAGASTSLSATLQAT